MPDLTVCGNQLTCGDKIFRCTAGKSGFTHHKIEGDGKTPIGSFLLRECWYRADRLSKPTTLLPTYIVHENDGWCDAPGSPNYNRHVALPFPVSHEKLWRNDSRYDLIIPLGYNDDPVRPGKGSAIFLHIAHTDYRGTEGCIAMAQQDLLALLPDLAITTHMHIHER